MQLTPTKLAHPVLLLALGLVLVPQQATQRKWSLTDMTPITNTPMLDSNLTAGSSDAPDLTPTQLAAKTRQKFEGDNNCKFEIQLFFLQDISESFKNDLDNVLKFIPAFLEDLLTVYPHSRFSVATFSDYPMPDVGWVRYSPRDHCFKQAVPFTGDTTQIENALRSITIVSGRDPKEAQMSALQHAAAGGYFSDLPPKATKDSFLLPVKLIVLSTDSEYHVAGDLAAELAKHSLYRKDAAKSKYFVSNADYHVVANNGDAYLACDSLYLEDYPSVEQVMQSLRSDNVGVLFLVAQRQVALYEQLAKQMHDAGLIAFVNTVKEDSSDILESLNQGIHHVYDEVCYRGANPTPLPQPPIGGNTGDNIATSTPFPNDRNMTSGTELESSTLDSTTSLFSTAYYTTAGDLPTTAKQLTEAPDGDAESSTDAGGGGAGGGGAGGGSAGGGSASSTLAPSEEAGSAGKAREASTTTSTTSSSAEEGGSNVAVIVGATAGVAAVGAAGVAAASFFGGATIFGASGGAAAAFTGADAAVPTEGADREMESGITPDMYA